MKTESYRTEVTAVNVQRFDCEDVCWTELHPMLTDCAVHTVGRAGHSSSSSSTCVFVRRLNLVSCAGAVVHSLFLFDADAQRRRHCLLFCVADRHGYLVSR